MCLRISSDGPTPDLNNICGEPNAPELRITSFVALIVTNGTTAYFASNTQVDNVAVVPKVQGGTALSSGNADSTDIYNLTVFKTADATFTMFLTQTQFA